LAAAEMALLGLSVAGQLPPPEMAAELIQALREGQISAPTSQTSNPLSESSARPKNQSLPSTPPTASLVSTSSAHSGSPAQAIRASEPDISENMPSPTPPVTALRPVAYFESFEAFVIAVQNEDIELSSNMKRYVRPILFQPTTFNFQPADNCPPSLTSKMADMLNNLTGATWDVNPLPSGGHETLKEKERREIREQEAKDRDHPAFSHPLLSSAKLIEIRDIVPTSQPESNVIAGDFDPDEK